MKRAAEVNYKIVNTDVLKQKSVAQTRYCGNTDNCNSTGSENRKILIIGDEYAKNCNRVLNNLINDQVSYKIQSIVKPNIEFSDLVEGLFGCALEYGSKDFVIVMFRTRNVSNQILLNRAIRTLLPISRTTNLIIVSKRDVFADQAIINYTVDNIRKKNGPLIKTYNIQHGNKL